MPADQVPPADDAAELLTPEPPRVVLVRERDGSARLLVWPGSLRFPLCEVRGELPGDRHWRAARAPAPMLTTKATESDLFFCKP